MARLSVHERFTLWPFLLRMRAAQEADGFPCLLLPSEAVYCGDFSLPMGDASLSVVSIAWNPAAWSDIFVFQLFSEPQVL